MILRKIAFPLFSCLSLSYILPNGTRDLNSFVPVIFHEESAPLCDLSFLLKLTAVNRFQRVWKSPPASLELFALYFWRLSFHLFTLSSYRPEQLVFLRSTNQSALSTAPSMVWRCSFFCLSSGKYGMIGISFHRRQRAGLPA